MSNAYDLVDRVAQVTRANTDGTVGPLSVCAYDGAGRTTAVRRQVTEGDPVLVASVGEAATDAEICLPGVGHLAGEYTYDLPGRLTGAPETDQRLEEDEDTDPDTDPSEGRSEADGPGASAVATCGRVSEDGSITPGAGIEVCPRRRWWRTPATRRARPVLVIGMTVKP